ncbi:CopD family protein [Vreelandella aquamarina]|uniref:copper resistance D family protein n=1 Tax=Vreelandella aquamarina TaxID=77097 RepID=UPI00384D3E2E
MAWWSAIKELDAWSAMMIGVAAGVYLSALIAMGAVLFRLAFPALPDDERRRVARMGIITAWIGIALVILQWPLQAGYLGGANITAATDPMLLGMVFDSAQGRRLILLVIGLVLIQALQFNKPTLSKLTISLSMAGILLVLLAFTQVGHSVNSPRLLLAGLLMVHVLTAAFWVASLWPLYCLAGSRHDPANTARILTRFGQIAMLVVGLLVIAGITLAAWLTGGPLALLTTDYGQLLAGKVMIVALLLLLAAANKWRWVPAFERGEVNASRQLQRSIALEILLVMFILVITATLTTTTSP